MTLAHHLGIFLGLGLLELFFFFFNKIVFPRHDLLYQHHPQLDFSTQPAFVSNCALVGTDLAQLLEVL